MVHNPSRIANAAAEPSEEIEITPEMIEAAIPILFDYDPRFSNEAETVSRIFVAMLGASCPKPRDQ